MYYRTKIANVLPECMLHRRKPVGTACRHAICIVLPAATLKTITHCRVGLCHPLGSLALNTPALHSGQTLLLSRSVP
jgi:hypothetical protein